MATTLRNFEPNSVWSGPDGLPSERAKGWTRSIVDRLNATPFIETVPTVNAAISATAGATYTASEQAMINDMKALLNQLRSALEAAGVVV
jgi:hypothetical protein